MNSNEIAGPRTCRCVLVVDDAASWRELVVLRLRKLGIATVSAASVMEAVDLLEHTSVDLVVTDHRMPGASGLDLLAYIHTRQPGLAVVVTSAVVDDALAAAALAGGAATILEKSELLPALRSIVVPTAA